MRRWGIGFIGLGLAAGLLGGTAAAQAPTPWLHVRVEEARGSKVNVNLPLPVVEAALKAAPDTIKIEDKIRIGKENCFRVPEMRKIWQELKRAGDVDLVTVEEDDEKVTVAKKGDLLFVKVTKNGSKEEVHVEVPSEVLDTLFEGDGDTLNVRGALTKLQARRGDIVRVNDKDSTVRVWIDEK
jgi:hypothetical protein